MGTDDVKGFLPRKRTTGRITQAASGRKRITPDNYAKRTSWLGNCDSARKRIDSRTENVANTLPQFQRF